MSIAQREEQILRIKAASFQSELNEALEQRIQEQVVATVKAILEAALDEELAADLTTWPGPKPRRSGSFRRSRGPLSCISRAFRGFVVQTTPAGAGVPRPAPNSLIC